MLPSVKEKTQLPQVLTELIGLVAVQVLFQEMGLVSLMETICGLLLVGVQTVLHQVQMDLFGPDMAQQFLIGMGLV